MFCMIKCKNKLKRMFYSAVKSKRREPVTKRIHDTSKCRHSVMEPTISWDTHRKFYRRSFPYDIGLQNIKITADCYKIAGV